MRTKQSFELEKQESEWIYLLHAQAPPHTRLSAESSLALPPALAPPPSLPPAMILSSQEKPSPLGLPSLNALRTTPRASPKASKRACFPKKCDFPLCKNSSRSRGFCYSHGGGRRCRVDGCSNGAVSRDLCKRHGGGRRCRIAGCTSSSESGGLCYSHGGGRRCSLSWCSARAKKGGFCAVHLHGDRTPPQEKSDVHPNVVETLLSLAKDQTQMKQETEIVPSTPTAGKTIASILN